MTVAARNVGVIMRALFGIGTPRSLQKGWRRVVLLFMTVLISVYARARRALTHWEHADDGCAAQCRLVRRSVA
jgi:hypothetical protein